MTSPLYSEIVFPKRHWQWRKQTFVQNQSNDTMWRTTLELKASEHECFVIQVFLLFCAIAFPNVSHAAAVLRCISELYVSWITVRKSLICIELGKELHAFSSVRNRTKTNVIFFTNACVYK
jgi:hypothetical protein